MPIDVQPSAMRISESETKGKASSGIDGASVTVTEDKERLREPKRSKSVESPSREVPAKGMERCCRFFKGERILSGREDKEFGRRREIRSGQ